jgi:DNA polymerase-3 subunit delta
MASDANAVIKEIKAGKIQPVYFLQGEEPYFIDLVSNYIEDNLLAESEKGFNQVVLYGKDAPMATILTNARRFPMMAERQVVLVKEAQDIPDLNKEAGAKLLLAYLQNPVPSTVLVFAHKHKTLDKRKELGKKIEKLATTITAKKFYDNQLPDFVAGYARDAKVAIEDNAVTALCEFVGNDLHRLTNEFDKLTISMPKGESVTVDRVMSHVGVSKEYNVFELQKSIIKRDSLTANKIVNYYESNPKKNPVIPAVAFLYSFFSKLLAASQLADKSDKGIASSLKMSPYMARDYSQALRLFSTEKLEESIRSIVQTDLKLKGVNTGSENDSAILRELVFKLIN